DPGRRPDSNPPDRPGGARRLQAARGPAASEGTREEKEERFQGKAPEKEKGGKARVRPRPGGGPAGGPGPPGRRPENHPGTQEQDPGRPGRPVDPQFGLEEATTAGRRPKIPGGSKGRARRRPPGVPSLGRPGRPGPGVGGRGDGLCECGRKTG